MDAVDQSTARGRVYDRAYFDRWYRSPTAARTPAEVRRLVTFVVAATEYVLGRPVRSVLDVGAGEGNWRAELRRLRPRVAYQGVDPSEYAVGRFGRRRNIMLGTLTALDGLPLADGYDLVVANGMLNYLSDDELRAGLPQLVRRADGMLFLEIFTGADDITGDTAFPTSHSAAWYRGVLRRAGVVGCGMHCYVPRVLRGRLAELERAV